MTLVQLLTRGNFITATQLAVEMGCSKVVAYKRLKNLRKQGHVLQTCLIREGVTGPKSRAYAIVTKRTRLPR